MLQHRYGPSIDIAKVEEIRAPAQYVGDFPGKARGGGWTADLAVSVFYQPSPPPPYTNRYFGLYQDIMTGRLMICDADYVEGHVFNAIDLPEGIVFSTCRHDYREVEGHIIDGGWDDFIRSLESPMVQVMVRDGIFITAGE